MGNKPNKAAYSRTYRRQYDIAGERMPDPAETHQEGDKLVMTIDGVRFIGIKNPLRGFYWAPENGAW